MAPPAFETRLFINNEYVDSQSGARLTVTNPYDNTTVTSDVHIAGQADVDRAVAAARAAQPAWRKTPPAERQACVTKLADLVAANAASLASLETVAMGQPLALATAMVQHAAGVLRYTAGWTDKLTGEVITPEFGTGENSTRVVVWEPLGVAVGILAWNVSQAFVATKVAPAVVGGNTIILKSSEKSPLGALAWGRLVREAGFPPGVIQFLSGDGSTGQMLAEHLGVDKISFTGSINAGRAVQMAATRSNLKRVTLELGGKSPCLVFEDADPERALQAMSDQFLFNSGQVCVATSRVLVQESVAEELMSKLKTRYEQAKNGYGNPSEMTTMLGPLVDAKQFDRVLGLIRDGEQAGGQIITGGKRWGESGLFLEPTIFLNPDAQNTIWKDEIFGPVLSVKTFKTEQEAIAIANDTSYGLSASVYTKDSARAMRVSQSLEAGTVGVNQSPGFPFNAPFGGYKMSGYGRELGREGVLAYMQSKTISTSMD